MLRSCPCCRRSEWRYPLMCERTDADPDCNSDFFPQSTDKGFTVCAYNRTTSKVDDFLANEAKGKFEKLPQILA